MSKKINKNKNKIKAKNTSINKNKVSKESDNNISNYSISKRLLVLLISIIVLFLILAGRLFFIQFFQGSELKEAANRQQTANRIISAKRGNIYDSTGKLLAASASVDTVSINPSRIKDENKEKVAKAFADIFALDYNEMLTKVKSEKSTEVIIKKVEQDKIEQLKTWMENNKAYSGINIDEDVKRYYPYGTLASNLIGFCNTDNVGQEGLERYWDNILAGTSGKMVTVENAASRLIPDKNESYVPAENGSNLTLTIDANIQNITEKYLEQACIENGCSKGGVAIVMNPHNGDILSMANYPYFDLNSPREPNSTLAPTWEELNDEEQLNALFKMWRNRAVADTYEPGSTFKVITAAVGLEENLVTTDEPGDFYCRGYELINGVRINCWKYETTHGSQSLRESLMNSCNPALMQLGNRIGEETLYKYYDAFGLFDKTGIATSSEANSQFWPLENVGNIELATMSFGQRFRITPIQLITAVSAIANDGVLVQPRIVKSIENTDTGAITQIDQKNVRQVVSKETANKMMDMLESVVSSGTGRYGQVNGYSVAGKTGTSEPDSNEGSYYVASFICISPVENPEVVVLVALHDPSGTASGGSMAAPAASQILTEVLPYLGVPSDDLSSEESSEVETTTLVDVRNKTVAEAQKIIEEAGFNCNISGEDTTVLVTDQVPKPGTALVDGANVYLYTAGNETRVSQEVPNLRGMSYLEARNALREKNLNIGISGTGKVISQDPTAGSSVEEGSIIHVNLTQTSGDSH
ncbi:MAG: PASTA domain-containing protein [Clostridia bacterium]|nr:PASTA domain-containing protein [Clostridia bacterium]